MLYILWGEGVTELKLVGEAVPFLSSKRLVVVRCLLERFEPEAKSSQPEKNGKTAAKNMSRPSPVDRLKEICRSLFEIALAIKPGRFHGVLAPDILKN